MQQCDHVYSIVLFLAISFAFNASTEVETGLWFIQLDAYLFKQQ